MGISRKLKKTFITGLFILIPLIVTAYIIYIVISFMDTIISPLMKNITLKTIGYELYIPGTGLIVFVLITYLAGVLASNYFGKKLLFYGETLLKKIPFVKGIYTSVKDIVTAFSSEKTRSFKEVVLIELPSKGSYAVGFITKRTLVNGGGTLCSVFIPTTPNPTSGILIMAKEEELTFLDMQVEDALKYIVSLGLTQTETQWKEKKPSIS